MSKEVRITKAGYEELKEKLDWLIKVERPKVAEQMKNARSYGDLSENAEYDEARNDQSRVEGEIAGIQEKLKHAVVVEDSEITSDAVNIGTVVTLLDLDENLEETYAIVGTDESNILENRISDDSPVGRLLMGRGVGDKVDVIFDNEVTARFEILNIERA